ncbi:hypothetical protein C8J56DRAFT_927276 [Mycena floridula]|nr:hypothetical protein C8J56DRAFT_927276 [Mycena floridula]
MDSNCKFCGNSPEEEPGIDAKELLQTLPTRVQELLSSGCPPLPDQETADLTSVLVDKSRKLEELESRIAEMRVEFKVLLEERARKQHELEAYKAVLHPIRRLPDEVLCEIFLSFVDEDLEQESSSLDSSLMPWLIPRVSSHWRAVALELPRLWSTIRIPAEAFTPSNKNSLSRLLFMLGVQIHRSGSHPLSVALLSLHDIPQYHPIVCQLLPSSPRWKKFHAGIPFHSLESLAPLTAFLPSLAELHLRAEARAPTPEEIRSSTIHTVFKIAPSLRTLLGDPRILARCQLPWSRITDYRSSWTIPYYSSDLLQLFSCLTDLQRCHIVYVDGIDYRNFPEPLQLNHLTELSLQKAVDTPIIPPLLDYLSIPGLSKLELHGLTEITSLLSFIERSSCSIEELHLESQILSDDDCLRILVRNPSLTSLTLDCPMTYTEKFMDRFIGLGTFLPSLQFLQLHNDIPYELPDFMILKQARPTLAFVAGPFAMR